MTEAAADHEESPVFAHHVRALLARMRQEDRELIGAHLGRAKFGRQYTDAGGGGRRGSGGIPFHLPSPLTGRDRQTGGFRVPHFDMKPRSKVYVPCSKGGTPHPACRKKLQTAGEHFDYAMDGAVVRHDTHLDYLWRGLSREYREAGLIMDALDERDLREEKNQLATYTNIPGDRDRQRSLFDAAERCEREPRVHALTASPRDLAALEELALTSTAPAWLAAGTAILRVAREDAERRAGEKCRPIYDRKVPIATLTLEDAYDALVWLDEQREHGSDLVEFKQGRTGRSHYRFVLELPADLEPQEHHAILTRFCESLGEEGWMVAGAIHEADPHADRRNPHAHVDAYDRPSTWLTDQRCWDFEYETVRNRKRHHPFRKPKVRYNVGENADGKPIKVDTATMMRERYIRIVNEVVGTKPEIDLYVTGRYVDHDVPLTPLEHMGNRVVSLEKRGEATEVGTINARRILDDDLRGCALRATQRREALEGETGAANGRTGVGGGMWERDRYRELKLEIIDRQLQAELVDVVARAGRSRADAIVRSFADEDRRHPSARPAHAALVDQARADIAWVSANSPSKAELQIEEDRLAALERKAARLLRDRPRMSGIRASGAPTMRYAARERKAPITNRVDPRFIDQDRGRLLVWLDRHAHRDDKLVIEGSTVTLDAAVPRSIDTLLVKMIDDDQIQLRLHREWQRRARLAAERDARAKARAASKSSTDPASAAQPEPIRPTKEVAYAARSAIDRDHVPSRAVAAARPRPRGLGQIRSLAGVRILPFLGVDPRSRVSGGLLHPVRGDDVRRAGEPEVHQPVRTDGSGDRRENQASGGIGGIPPTGSSVPATMAAQKPSVRDIPRGGLAAQAAALPPGSLVRPKGQKKEDAVPPTPSKRIER